MNELIDKVETLLLQQGFKPTNTTEKSFFYKGATNAVRINLDTDSKLLYSLWTLFKHHNRLTGLDNMKYNFHIDPKLYNLEEMTERAEGHVKTCKEWCDLPIDKKGNIDFIFKL